VKVVTRRKALQILGAGVGVLSGACGGTGVAQQATTTPTDPDSGPIDVTPNTPDAGGAVDSAVPPELDAAADAAASLDPTHEELLSTIDTVIVLMMENRSFDHLLGALKQDTAYANAGTVDGLTGNESNPPSSGTTPVKVWKTDNYTPADPPHDWDPVHQQWNYGANDGFVKAHAGASENDVMGYHDRSQIPFYYWLADKFTICDRWFASVLGPTWPNRYFLHATTSAGKKDNSAPNPLPATIWDRMKAQGKTFKNYYDGPVPWYYGAFLGKLTSLNPAAQLTQFFADAKAGTLPSFAVIDPDFTASDDHPSHDILRGQAFVASIYKALAESPQWSRCLFVITYDEHGGFYDHVPPPPADDDDAAFSNHGFRVPAIVVGGTVRRGYVNKTVLEHSSIAKTMQTKYGFASLSKRMDGATDLSSCIDPKLYKNPAPPPLDPPPVTLGLHSALTDGVGESSQPQLDAMIASGAIPSHLVDSRPAAERISAWLAHGERLGAVKLTR
jgi:phospholipase C